MLKLLLCISCVFLLSCVEKQLEDDEIPLTDGAYCVQETILKASMTSDITKDFSEDNPDLVEEFFDSNCARKVDYSGPALRIDRSADTIKVVYDEGYNEFTLAEGENSSEVVRMGGQFQACQYVLSMAVTLDPETNSFYQLVSLEFQGDCSYTENLD